MPVGDRRSGGGSSARVGGVWFRGPLGPRCRSETGAPVVGRRRGLAVCGFAALSGRDAGRRPALQRWVVGAGLGCVVSRPSRAAMPVGDRRSSGGSSARVWGVWFRGPLGPRCRSETGAPAVGRRRGLAVCGFAALSGRDAGRRPALQRWVVGAGLGCVVSRPSRAAMPVGDRRSSGGSSARVWGVWFRGPLGPRCRSETGAPMVGRRRGLGVCGFAALSGRDAGRRPALQRWVVGAGWLFVVSRPSRAAMPVGDWGCSNCGCAKMKGP